MELRVKRQNSYSLYFGENGVRVPKKAGACSGLNISNGPLDHHANMSSQNIKEREWARLSYQLAQMWQRKG